MPAVSRRVFVTTSAAALIVPAGGARRAAVASGIKQAGDGLPESFPAQEPERVREVVGKSHVDYEGVRDLVTSRPQLAKATWDWGFGDWESALGAASHMGRRDIAELLIAHGARPNLFTFAMFGQVDVVRALCEANPGIQRLHGPHGLTLLHHARMGREKAAAVVEYLEELGDADIRPERLPLDEQAAQIYLGAYQPRGAEDAVFLIDFHRRQQAVTFQRDERQLRFLNYRGDHTFSPGGAAAVRIAFEVSDAAALRLTILDGGLEIIADRMG